jgi:hypothetical protein
MNATRSVWMAAALVLVLTSAFGFGFGCKNSQYCDSSTSSCPSGTQCDLTTHACVTTDGGGVGTGGHGGGGGHAGGGGMSFSCDASPQCVGHDGAFCEIDAGACVECLKDTDCPTAAPLCDGNKCRACRSGTTECNASYPTTPVCSSGACVECGSSSDCLVATKPICDLSTNSCKPCTSDAQCSASGPGVCMSQTDGHCATSAETIYVQDNTSGPSTCSDTAATAGTSSQPFCSMQPVPSALSASLDLVVVRGTVSGGTSVFAGQGAALTSIVGQQSAFIASGASPAFSMQSGSIYIRNIIFSSSASVGISATGGTLHLDTVTVDSCKGGGLFLDGTAFEIDNTTVTNNGPGQHGTTTWGGILVNSLPPAGLTNLDLVTIQDNKQIGLTCSDGISGTDVFASGNSGGVDVSPTCKIDVCSPLGPTCGASP